MNQLLLLTHILLELVDLLLKNGILLIHLLTSLNQLLLVIETVVGKINCLLHQHFIISECSNARLQMSNLSFVLNVLLLWDNINIMLFSSIGCRECCLVLPFFLISLKSCYILLELMLFLKCLQQGVMHLFCLFYFLLELQLQLLPFVEDPELLESNIHLHLALTQLQAHLLLLLD